MNEAEIIGFFFVALVPVIISTITLFKYISDPLKQLNINIVKLTATVDRLLADNIVQDRRLDRHGEEIDNLNIKVHEHDVRLGTLERK